MFEMRYMGLPKGSSICFQPQCEPGSLTPGPFEPESLTPGSFQPHREPGSLTPGSFQPQLWYNFIDNFVDSERMFTEAVEAADDADKL